MKLTQEILWDLLDYDFSATGLFWWRVRPVKYFEHCQEPSKQCKIWNKRYAGTQAFTLPDEQGRLTSAIFNKTRRAHQIAWLYVYGVWARWDIDHKDGNPANNRITNLQDVPHGVNMKNMKKPKDNTSGYIGVSYDKARGLWRAYTASNGKRYELGRYKTAEQAAQVAAEGRKRLGGFGMAHGI